MVEASSELDDGFPARGFGDRLADVEAAGILPGVQAEVIAVGYIERTARRRGAGGDVAGSVDDVDANDAVDVDEAFLDQSGKIRRSGAFEFVLDQQRRSVGVVDRAPRRLLEGRDNTLRVMQGRAEQRAFAGGELQQRPTPYRAATSSSPNTGSASSQGL